MLDITTGVHDIPSEKYHSLPHVSRSQLLKLRKTPLHYWYEYESGLAKTEESKEHFVFGSAFHTAILEPHLFHKEYVVSPKFDRRTKQGKIDAEFWNIEHQGKQSLDQEQYDKIIAMNKVVQASDQAMTIINNAKIEQSFFWKDEETAVGVKARPDIWQPTVIGDLKSSMDASQYTFEKSIYTYGYHIQAAMIREAHQILFEKDIEDFVYIVIEKEPPYAMAIYILDESALIKGADDYKKLLFRLAECRYNKLWPGYPSAIVKLPNYANYEEI